ncbi:MAG: CoA-acylating methylmalonate-semialdehyde dehydrogenase [Rhodospirillales bacterium]|nr:CoA-acylating methylmalonate-semialdehyde dehydrogenase [Rhodospirillales bacterium]
MVDQIRHFIGGVAVDGRSGRFAPVFDPASGDVRAHVPLADAGEVDAAVMAAKQAFPAWAAMPALSRARVMFRFKTLIEQHADELAALITAEHGKVASDARGSLMRGLEVVEFACGIPHHIKGEFSAGIGAGMDCFSLREPLGVCAGITPFNFPAMVPMWMFPLAIACGNTFVLKPSEKVPSCSLRLAELLSEAGLPAGVFNVLGGDAVAVKALLTHPQVRAVSFVGSTPVARRIYATAAAAGKRVQALAGAKNHMVVMPDADLDLAVEALMGAAYGSAGERCMAVSVAVAVGEVAEPLRERLATRVSTLKIGPGSDLDAEMGPLITAEHRARVAEMIGLGVREGADLVVDGRGLVLSGRENGFFLGGTLFDRVAPSMRIYQEEIFGPVLCIVRASDLASAIDLVNANRFGNGSAIFTHSGAAARAFTARVQAGMVGVNVAIPVPLAFHSFGGWKHSLFGDHAIHGAEGVRFYTRLKTVTSRWPDAAGDGDTASPGPETQTSETGGFAMPTLG